MVDSVYGYSLDSSLPPYRCAWLSVKAILPTSPARHCTSYGMEAVDITIQYSTYLSLL
jgi:hypothetical protein